ncbi:MAG TPA: hypothetical protein VMC10_23545 [Stellaceae bacterium]|nr:hypothetical protein [Stellaceae bacterium]
MRPRTRYLIAALALASGMPKAARADEFYGFVQSTCAPEIGYFSIRRFQLVNLPHGHPYGFPDSRTPDALSRLSALGTQYGIYDSISLREAPLECDLSVNLSQREGATPGTNVKVRAVGVYDGDNGHASSERQISDYVEIFAGRSLVGRLFLDAYGFSSDGTDLIEIASNGLTLEATVCSRPLAVGRGNGGCVRRDLDAAVPANPGGQRQ